MLLVFFSAREFMWIGRSVEWILIQKKNHVDFRSMNLVWEFFLVINSIIHKETMNIGLPVNMRTSNQNKQIWCCCGWSDTNWWLWFISLLKRKLTVSFLKVKTFQGLHAIVYTFSHTCDYNINLCLLYESMYVLAGWKRISPHKIFQVKVKSEIQNISGTKQLTNILFDILIVTQMQKKIK